MEPLFMISLHTKNNARTLSQQLSDENGLRDHCFLCWKVCLCVCVPFRCLSFWRVSSLVFLLFLWPVFFFVRHQNDFGCIVCQFAARRRNPRISTRTRSTSVCFPSYFPCSFGKTKDCFHDSATGRCKTGLWRALIGQILMIFLHYVSLTIVSFRFSISSFQCRPLPLILMRLIPPCFKTSRSEGSHLRFKIKLFICYLWHRFMT